MKEITLLVKIKGPFLRGALGDCLSCLYARAGCAHTLKHPIMVLLIEENTGKIGLQLAIIKV